MRFEFHEQKASLNIVYLAFRFIGDSPRATCYGFFVSTDGPSAYH